LHQQQQQQGATVEAAMSEEALMDAAREGMLEEVKQLVEAGANLVAVDEDGRTPLHHAIINEHEAVALYLIEQIMKRHPPSTLDVPMRRDAGGG
jgi:hypothetical protein